MADQLPPPPYPAHIDLNHFDDMPLEVRRLRDSGIAGVADAEVFRCAVLLWCFAWHQVPAGAIPSDDSDLCRNVGLGRDLKTWNRIKAGVLRGWMKAADGRLYHPVVAEKVVEAWNGSIVNRWKKRCDSIRNQNKDRAKKNLSPLEFPVKPEPIPLEWPASSDGTSTGKSAERKGKERKGKEDPTVSSAAASPVEAARPQPEDVPVEALGGDQLDAPDQAQAVDHTAQSGDQSDDPDPIPEFLRRQPAGPQAATDERAMVDEAHRLWMTVAYDLRIPEPGFLHADRREALAARLRECGGLDGWKLALDRLREAQWLRDEDDPSKPKHWLNLATICKPENFTGLMEGRYAEPHHPKGRGSDGRPPTVTDGVSAAFARRYAPTG